MILYLDTSSLVKLYVEEEGSDEVRELVEEARTLATATVAYPEMRSALARLLRGGFLDQPELARLRGRFEEDWESFLRVEVSEELCRQAGELAEVHGLRGFDSVHLAAFVRLGKESGEVPVRFSSFDQRLNDAATAESGPGA